MQPLPHKVTSEEGIINYIKARFEEAEELEAEIADLGQDISTLLKFVTYLQEEFKVLSKSGYEHKKQVIDIIERNYTQDHLDNIRMGDLSSQLKRTMSGYWVQS